MIVIPAIDIYKESIVRLYKGDFNNISFFNNNNNINIFSFIGFYIVNNLCRLLNIIDLEGSLFGSLCNYRFIKNCFHVLSYYGFKVFIGGGIRSIHSINLYLGLGFECVILSTSCIYDLSFFKSIYSIYPKKIVISLDILNGFIMLKGWKFKYLSLDSFLCLIDFYSGPLIFTNISRDGTLKGVCRHFIRYIIDLCIPNNIILSGGFSGINCYLFLKKYKKNIYGYIVGKYFYNIVCS